MRTNKRPLSGLHMPARVYGLASHCFVRAGGNDAIDGDTTEFGGSASRCIYAIAVMLIAWARSVHV